MATQDEYIKTALRLPRDLHKQVQDSAEMKGRSMNAEIIERLAQSFEEHPVSTDKNVMILSVIERLEGMLAAKELELDNVERYALYIAAAFAASYPITRSILHQSPDWQQSIGSIVGTGLKATRQFIDAYEPRGLDRTLESVSKIGKIFAAHSGEIADEMNEFSATNWEADGDDEIKRMESQLVERIVKVLDEEGIEPAARPVKSGGKRLVSRRPKEVDPD